MGTFFRIIKYILILVVVMIAFLILASLVFENSDPGYRKVKYGVSFSPRYARYLNLNWKEAYIQILDELGVKNIRLPSYWTSLEPQVGQYDFSETDFMLYETEKRGVNVILVVGLKQPRWPECHIPDWAKNLSDNQMQQKTLELIQKVVEQYKDNKSIKAWQVENEPYVNWFGENCDKSDKNFLKQEIELVKKIGGNKPIIVTDSGEWSFWGDAMKSSDILGVSLYRKTFNPYFGYITYPFLVSFYSIKSSAARVFAPQNQKTIISELQAEPWVKEAVPDTQIDEQAKLFSVEDLKTNVDYAQKTGFDEVYLWGVEWWYYIARQGHPEYLEYAKTLFK